MASPVPTLNPLEKENARLKKLVADGALDNAILKEVRSRICHVHVIDPGRVFRRRTLGGVFES